VTVLIAAAYWKLVLESSKIALPTLSILNIIPAGSLLVDFLVYEKKYFGSEAYVNTPALASVVASCHALWIEYYYIFLKESKGCKCSIASKIHFLMSLHQSQTTLF